jgi:hypothetical protein
MSIEEHILDTIQENNCLILSNIRLKYRLELWPPDVRVNVGIQICLHFLRRAVPLN